MPEVLPIPRCGEHRQCLACAFPFWNKLTADQQELLCRAARPVRYRRGERVHSPVENCVGILLLRTGQFRAYLLSDDGRDVTLYRLFGGEICILSASCVMDSVNFDLYIDAEEDTEAYCISAGVFRSLMQQNVEVRCFAYQMTAERFSDTMWTMQQILFMSADRRLAIFLADELAKTGGEDDVGVVVAGHEAEADVRDAVSPGESAAEGLTLVWLHRHDADIVRPRLDRLAHAGDGAAAAHPDDDAVHDARAFPGDGAHQRRPGDPAVVGGVVVAAQPVHVEPALLGGLCLGLRPRPGRACLRGGVEDLCPEAEQAFLPHGRGILRHDQNHRVARRLPRQRQRRGKGA